MPYFCGFKGDTTLEDIRQMFQAEYLRMKVDDKKGAIIQYINKVRATQNYKGACDNFFITVLGTDNIENYWASILNDRPGIPTLKSHALRAAYIDVAKPADGTAPEYLVAADLDACFDGTMTLAELEAFYIDPKKCKIKSSHPSFAGQDIEFKPSWRNRLLKILTVI